MASESQKYPVGVQSFRDLRRENYLYVDKTRYIWDLMRSGKYYFLSRPRRFGKSLLISTMEAYYLGERELFKGLALDTLTEDWEPHPVLHLDLSNHEYKASDSLIAKLNYHLENWEKLYGDDKKDRAPEERFAWMIRHAYAQSGKKVVILVDEYDKPLLNAISRPELAEIYRSQLKAFYSNLKAMDEYIEIGLLTGVARFTKVSIFSDLNNLRDISFEDRFAGICGITSEELDKYFVEGIAEFAEKTGMSQLALREELRHRYDGYHFAKESPDIYNPFSLMTVFSKMDFGDFWIESGTPEFLVSIIEDGGWGLTELAPVEIDADYLQSAGLLARDPIAALYQTGYLTIKRYDWEFRSFFLDYPNEEVRNGFAKSLVPFFIEKTGMHGRFSIQKFVRAITSGDVDVFMRLLETMIAGVPYSEKGSAEAHFQNACYLLFTLMGQFVKIEDRTSDGRIDLTVETAAHIYIFEFKIDSTPEEAMEQIKRKRYWLKYEMNGKKITLIGANFDTHTRRLTGYLADSPREN